MESMPHHDTNAGVTRRNTSHNCHSRDNPADAAPRGRTGADHDAEPRQDGVGVGHLLGGAIGVRARGERIGPTWDDNLVGRDRFTRGELA